jgi:hypothetical protein
MRLRGDDFTDRFVVVATLSREVIRRDRAGPHQGGYRMKLSIVLATAAIYMALVGLGMMFVPHYFGVGAVPPDAPPALIAFLRIFGGPCLGIAVLNWLSRNAEPSRTRDAVVLGNIVGFGAVATMDIWGVLSGDARETAKLFLVIHLLLTFAFVFAFRGSARAVRGVRRW